jgi:hypothetical protein
MISSLFYIRREIISILTAVCNAFYQMAASYQLPVWNLSSAMLRTSRLPYGLGLCEGACVYTRVVLEHCSLHSSKFSCNTSVFFILVLSPIFADNQGVMEDIWA